jgi:4-oxalocrotonate tautomerase family enzyme
LPGNGKKKTDSNSPFSFWQILFSLFNAWPLQSSRFQEEAKMPHVQVTWVAGRDAEQKRKLAERITQALIEDGRAKRENIHVTFVDLPATDYAEAGVLVVDQKRNP